MLELNNKKAIVFGGTSGIGLAIVKDLHHNGAKVVAIGRDAKKAESLPEDVRFAACDVRDETAITTLFQTEGDLDVLISAATGGERALGPFSTMDMDAFRRSFDKMWGYANVVKFGLPHLKESGSITLISGSPARRGGPGQIAISTAGGAVEAFIKHLAKEIAPIRINGVAPGLIDTPMFGNGEDRRKFLVEKTKGQPIPRAGAADEIAQAVHLLITNEFMTGTIIDVDGGVMAS